MNMQQREDALNQIICNQNIQAAHMGAAWGKELAKTSAASKSSVDTLRPSIPATKD